MFAPHAFFDLTNFEHRALFADAAFVWDALKRLKEYMAAAPCPELDRRLLPNGVPLPRAAVFHEGKWMSGADLQIEYGDATRGRLLIRQGSTLLEGASLVMAGAVLVGEGIGLGRGVLVESGAMVKGPALIGDNTEIRQGAYLRGHCLAGRRCVLGHTTEIKHAIFLDDAKAGHFAYVGDSVIGNNANLGAGTKLANLRFTGGDVPVKTAAGPVSSGLRKLGAILGDGVQTGCNSVTNPGTVIGRRSILLPNTTAPSGYHGASSLIR